MFTILAYKRHSEIYYINIINFDSWTNEIHICSSMHRSHHSWPWSLRRLKWTRYYWCKFVFDFNIFDRAPAEHQTNLAACGLKTWTSDTLTTSSKVHTVSKCRFGWRLEKMRPQVSSSMVSSPSLCSSRTSISPSILSEMKCLPIELKFSTQLVYADFSSMWTLPITLSPARWEAQTTVFSVFLRLALLHQISCPLLQQVSSSWGME